MRFTIPSVAPLLFFFGWAGYCPPFIIKNCVQHNFRDYLYYLFFLNLFITLLANIYFLKIVINIFLFKDVENIDIY